MIQIGNKFGNFMIQGEIGKGGMGTIYHAVDLMLNREVALKIIHPQFTDNAQLMERFKIEAMTQARMNHPNIVMIFSFNKIDDEYVIAMEYIAGKSLKELLREKKMISPGEAVYYLMQILEGLKYSHCLNVIHRDIKPANILISHDNRIKISDFGIAKIFGTEGLTKTGILVGTPWYTSPEQILGKNIDFRSDLYSLGVTFFEMVTGRVPFDSPNNSEFQVQRAHLETPPPRPSQYNAAIDPDMERFIMKALQKKADKRFQTADEMMITLNEIHIQSQQQAWKVSPAPVKSKIDRPTSPLKVRKRSLNPVKAVGFSIIVLTLLLVGGFVTKIFKFPQKFQQGQLEDQAKKSDLQKDTKETPSVEENSGGTGSQEPSGSVGPDSNAKGLMNSTENRFDAAVMQNRLQDENQSEDSAKKEEMPSTMKNMGKASVETVLTQSSKDQQKPGKNEPSAAEKTEEMPEQKKLEPAVQNMETLPPLDIKSEIHNFKRMVDQNQLSDALRRIETLYSQRKPPELYSWIGYLNYLNGKFSRAEEYWRNAWNNGQSIEVSLTHVLAEDRSARVGTLRISREGGMLFRTESPKHTFMIGAADIVGVEYRREGLVIIQKNPDKTWFLRATKGIIRNNSEREKFLTEFLTKYLLNHD